MKNLVLISGLAALFALIGCGGPADRDAGGACPPDAQLTGADRAGIREGLADAVAAALEGDWQAFAARFDKDVTMMPPGAPLYTGRDAILAGFDGVTITGFVSGIDVLEGCGDLAYARGQHEWTMRLVGRAAPYSESGKWVAIWRRADDGTWRVAVDIWNSDTLSP